MTSNPRARRTALSELAGVGRVARALVGAGGLSVLSENAMSELGDVLDLDLAVLYLADAGGQPVLRCIGKWPPSGVGVSVRETISLDREALSFVTASGGPLVFVDPSTPIIDNPFDPPPQDWIAIPLVAADELLGMVFGCARRRISLRADAVARLTVIGDLLSAGAAATLLRAEVRRAELQQERTRLVEEIHDSLAQDLAAAVRELALLRTRPSEQVARASENRLREAVEQANMIVRRQMDILAGDVVGPDLRAGVEELRARFQRHGLLVTLTGELPDARVDPAIVSVIYRVLNEALTNVERHAGVSEAVVSLAHDGDMLRIAVSDRGRGFRADTPVAGDGHFGLAIMRSRVRAAGGRLEIRSEPEAGTVVEVSLPAAAHPGDVIARESR
jgi:signal transduction histidine kinase